MQKPVYENICPVCFAEKSRNQTLENWFWNRDILCGSCRSLFIPAEGFFSLGELRVFALYHYEEQIENLLYQYKENRDVALADSFFWLHAHQITRRYRGYTMVGMPSSADKTAERGFHHLKRMLEVVRLPYADLFEKDNAYKQSLKNGAERFEIASHMRLKKDAVIPDTPLLLIDDVCTTGATLKQAYRLLEKHTMVMEALVLSVHEKIRIYPGAENTLRWKKGRKKQNDRKSKMV